MGGRDLTGVRARPLVARDAWPRGRVVPNRVVFEPHEYPWLYVSHGSDALQAKRHGGSSNARARRVQLVRAPARRGATHAVTPPPHTNTLRPQGAFNFANYTAFAAQLDRRWGYIAKEGIAPIWIGARQIYFAARTLFMAWAPVWLCRARACGARPSPAPIASVAVVTRRPHTRRAPCTRAGEFGAPHDAKGIGSPWLRAVQRCAPRARASAPARACARSSGGAPPLLGSPLPLTRTLTHTWC